MSVFIALLLPSQGLIVNQSPAKKTQTKQKKVGHSSTVEFLCAAHAESGILNLH